MLVTIICGSKEDKTDHTAGSTDCASYDFENEDNTVVACRDANVSTVDHLSPVRQHERGN